MVRTQTSASAKKRLKKTRDARYRRGKRERIIDIGDQCDRWRRVKEATGVETDEKMMEILIDAYLDSHCKDIPELINPGKRKLETPPAGVNKRLNIRMESTPIPGTSSKIPELPISSVSEASSTDVWERQGIAVTSREPKIVTALITKGTRVGDLTTSDTDDLYDVDYDPNDPTYDPGSFELSIVYTGL
ncbi:uncharacterized protein LOC127879173 [Dreissena polymorpha]|uniref:Uncharacterized protein n=1 Tax=Dreissena polymorpha TaxID=45954 RepID=A0A9D4QKI8_DREPO|nr:uncharacterized protein LOC127879173 [Dreissena polymorpha]KAH3833627.1 hypothetical protein DPMN_106939 [Dreissena polymorpha]